MNGFLLTLVVIAMLITLAVLFAGLFAMAKGGDFNKKYSNKLMRWRIAAQTIAIALFALAMMLADKT